MTAANPYDPPGSPVTPPDDAAPAARRPASRWPLGVIALVAWVFPGGVMLTWFIAAYSFCLLVGRKDGRAALPAALGGVGMALHILTRQF